MIANDNTTPTPPRDRAAEAAWLRLGREITERAREIGRKRKGTGR